MPSQDSVTHWIELLQAGDHAAIRPLWERYFGQLVHRARSALRASGRAENTAVAGREPAPSRNPEHLIKAERDLIQA
jgi:hypothetical protein